MPRITYPSTWEQASRDALDDLFTRARVERLWFFHGGLSGPLWFSPAELQAEQEKGTFVWGAGNWQLRSPLERLAQIDTEVRNLHVERDKLLKRIG